MKSKILTSTEIHTKTIQIINKSRLKNPYFLPAYIILYLTGCRTSEVLNRDLWHIDGTDEIVLNPQKNNDLRRFDKDLNFNGIYLLGLINHHIYNVGQLTTLNRDCLEMSGNKVLMSGKKIINATIFRHNFIKQLYSNGLTVPEIQLKMGHHKESSTLNYIDSEILEISEN